MAINKQIKLTWDGKEYQTTINMLLIDKLDDQVNLAKMVVQNASGDVRATKVAALFAVILNHAGASVEVDDVFHALFGSGKIEGEEVQAMLAGIFSAIFPEPKKKTITRSTKKKPAKKKVV